MAEWQAAMSSHEFAEWVAFFQLQPYGEWREDFRAACLMALIANVNRDAKKSNEFLPKDFMPSFDYAEYGSAQDDEESDLTPDDEERDAVAKKIETYFSALATKK